MRKILRAQGVLVATPPVAPALHTPSKGSGLEGPVLTLPFLHCRLKTAMSSEAPTTRQLSEYLKHAKGQARTAIRNGQVWEESLKRLRQEVALTNTTGTENPLTL